MTETFDIRSEIQTRRTGRPRLGGNPHRFVELTGAREVLYQYYEPDPNTTRETYYYNTRLNALFLRLQTTNPITKQKTQIWKMVSQC